ncbi:YifB family Mg chelatase-like AAA ATPase [Sphaerisporangium sp. TRM90804]|uniref:YifB family Mg chelatase-like AAA ATPase n=1 Tax=Sphaerisporangium sp. TRM90804 TaxID=3031113 RepID=UPI0024494D60|nr:YifB family Mg chelatase-like AAA ATPase [Sphaerisporangium sp. TRM90804]MDH2430102.1 YifB family Mg chelatase-like AAA ATPase [Sphaerisporangium sp. TRM90804]
MPVARTRSVALVGVSGHVVEVEADVGHGIAGVSLIGMLDTALSEARDRVRSAIVNSRYAWPDARVTVSLFPASLPKRGSLFDLAIAVALLGAAGLVPRKEISSPIYLGELGLDGTVRPVRGVLPAVVAAAEAGASSVVVPMANAAEAALVPGVAVTPVLTLAELVESLRGGGQASMPVLADTSPPPAPPAGPPGCPAPDLSDIAGQAVARRALEVCAAGGHNLWMMGQPGTGKTMLAERLPTLLPRLDRDQALEVTAIHSVAGTLPPDRPMLAHPPFMAPHHTATVAAIVGGGSSVIRPGAVSLAHRGVLFLDEAPEFPARVLDSLRQPLESGQVTVARAAVTVTFPARFMLVLAANPCPCAQASTPESPCRCTPTQRRRYLARLSGPLLDRVDVKVGLTRSTRRELLADRQFIEPSEVVAERVLLARERTLARLRGTPWRCNAEVPSAALHGAFRPASAAMSPLYRCLDTGELSARGLDRVLRLSWTLADLTGKPAPEVPETTAALALWTGTE